MSEKRKSRYTDEGIRHVTINNHRFHLRLTDPTKDNFLWIDGRPPLLLDQVAAEFVGYLIDAMWTHQQGDADGSEQVRSYVVDAMFKKYRRPIALPGKRVTRQRIADDFDRIFGTLTSIADGTCPVEVGLEMQEISSTDWIAPARMDLAITYRCNLDCAHCYTGKPDTTGVELTFDDWLKVYEALWRIGIPNIVFTGGEPTLREDLVQLVSQADEFVTGLVTNGTRLAELAKPLRDASLDYAQITLESHDAKTHNAMVNARDEDAFAATVEGIRACLAADLQVITNTTLTTDNAEPFQDLLRFGKDIGLRHMCCNTLICSGRGTAAKKEKGLPMEELKRILEQAIPVAEDLGINLQWYSPTCYNELDPLALGFGAKGCSAAANNMTIQPDGTVLPCQSWPDTVGHILTDNWPSIWNHPTCKKLREHGFAQEQAECKDCEVLPVCGGGCPLEKMEGSQ